MIRKTLSIPLLLFVKFVDHGDASIFFGVWKEILSICNQIFPLSFTMIFNHQWFPFILIAKVENYNCWDSINFESSSKCLCLSIFKINLTKLDSFVHNPRSFFKFRLKFDTMYAIWSHKFNKPDIFWSHNRFIKILRI